MSLGTTTLYNEADAVRQFQSVETMFNAALDGAAGAGGAPAATASRAVPSCAACRRRRSCRRGDDGGGARGAEGRAEGAGGHGRARVLEREVRVGVARTPTRDSVTVVQAPFENDDTGASTTFWSRSR
ncbi:hypothetical protein [Burkholderia stagnalis]|uniref:hypothetical protein n=1 Tax=Burkholderia stagnalis TaxID=1503054 RepID=UPI0021AB9549|nr:hypothetical protein [Burkholderia stagnalis]